MSPKEEEVSLVVEGDHLATFKLGERREQRAVQSADRETQPGLEVVENQFGRVRSRSSVSLR